MTWNLVLQIAALTAIGLAAFVIILAAIAAVRKGGKNDV